MLEMEGFDTSGNKTCSYAIRSSGSPFALTATIEDNSIANGKGIAQISIQVVDDKESDMGNYHNNRQQVFNGRLLAYIQATGQSETISVKFSAPWLKPVEEKIVKNCYQFFIIRNS